MKNFILGAIFGAVAIKIYADFTSKGGKNNSPSTAPTDINIIKGTRQ